MADGLLSKCSFSGVGMSPWSFKKNNDQRMQSLLTGELNIILAIQSVDFSREKYNLLLPLLAS